MVMSDALVPLPLDNRQRLNKEGNDIKSLKMDVLQAICFIIRSWDEITPETI